MILPEINPVLIEIGPFALRWYGISWLVAFFTIYLLAKNRLSFLSENQLSDLMFYGLLGAVIGGRVGYMLFYNIDQLGANIFSIFYIWQGGLSFHGGLLGVLVTALILSKRWKISFFDIMDFIAPCVPFGLGWVRIGNFLNAELLGRETSLPWGVIFPGDPLGLSRHPSQIYQAFSEAFLLGFFLLWFAKQQRPKKSISALFLIGYGLIRCLTEMFREPDSHIGFDLFDAITRGQLLPVPMILAGFIILAYSYKYNKR